VHSAPRACLERDGLPYEDCDFGALLELEANAAGLELKSENMEIGDGLTGKS
jgi:hypothetical protein